MSVRGPPGMDAPLLSNSGGEISQVRSEPSSKGVGRHAGKSTVATIDSGRRWWGFTAQPWQSHEEDKQGASTVNGGAVPFQNGNSHGNGDTVAVGVIGCDAGRDGGHYVELQSRGGGKSSAVQATFNGVNVLAGVGILSTPYALSEGGWASLAILFLLAVVCCWTGMMLRDCMEKHAGIRSYPDIGEAAFGRWGRIFTCSLLYMELYLVTVEFLILEGDNLAGMFPHVQVDVGGYTVGAKQCFILLSTLVVLPTVHVRDLSLLSYISAVGVCSTALVVVAVSWLGLVDGVGQTSASTDLVRWSGLPMAAGLFGFCFSAHAVFPNIYTSMQEPRRFPQVLVASFAFCTALYAGIAVMGYGMFGDSLKSQITLNLPPNRPASQCAIWMTIIVPFAKYAITLTPVALALEESLPSHDQATIQKKGSGVMRTSLVLSTTVVALAVPFFGFVMAFIGAFLSMSMSIVLPCACYLKMFGSSSGRVRRWTIGAVMVVGAGVALAGTFASLKNIAGGLHQMYIRDL